LNVNVETTIVSVIDEPCYELDTKGDLESRGCDHDTACGSEKDSKEFIP
jgi:hypothetical protein